MKPLVFTGCGRSGTGYVAQVLTLAGVDCGHERIFRGRATPEEQGRLEPATVESSWFAAPFLEGSTLAEVLVVHLVRDPRTWVDSWLRSRVSRYPNIRRYMRFWCPELLQELDPRIAAMRYWLQWNRRVERLAALRIRIEEIDEAQLGLALQDSGRPRLEGALYRAMLPTNVPPNWNTKGGQPRRLEWDELPTGPTKRKTMAMAEELGY
jgi:hypothetical protein